MGAAKEWDAQPGDSASGAGEIFLGRKDKEIKGITDSAYRGLPSGHVREKTDSGQDAFDPSQVRFEQQWSNPRRMSSSTLGLIF